MNSFLNDFTYNKEDSLRGRFIDPRAVSGLLMAMPMHIQKTVLGRSVNGLPIEMCTLGNGAIKVLIWSQMHGNESTSTKAVFDLLRTLAKDPNDASKNLLSHFTLYVIPVLNPDGALTWNRLNANGVDLNRDAQNLSQIESVILRNAFDSISPDFCFNLHGQRTIYGFERTGKPSVLSFLAPSADSDRTVTLSRKRSMQVIAAIHQGLSYDLFGKIGRYDDTFNLNCVGDSFQAAGVPTILFEAGHYAKDYEREVTRRYFWESLLLALSEICNPKVSYDDYFNIPEHQQCFCDVLIHNVKLPQDSSIDRIAVQYNEVLTGTGLRLVPTIHSLLTNSSSKLFGHEELSFDQLKKSTKQEWKIGVTLQNLWDSLPPKTL